MHHFRTSRFYFSRSFHWTGFVPFPMFVGQFLTCFYQSVDQNECFKVVDSCRIFVENMV